MLVAGCPHSQISCFIIIIVHIFQEPERLLKYISRGDDGLHLWMLLGGMRIMQIVMGWGHREISYVSDVAWSYGDLRSVSGGGAHSLISYVADVFSCYEHIAKCMGLGK